MPEATAPVAGDSRTSRADLRQKAGCWLTERWQAELVLRTPIGGWCGWTWRDLRNRIDRISAGPDGISRFVHGSDSSYLTVARIYPSVGARLLGLCLAESPIQFNGEVRTVTAADPEVSVVIPCGGVERLSQLQAVVDCLLNQAVVSVEVLVVCPRESLISAGFPPGATIHATDAGPAGQGFNKSRLFNAGVAAARAEIVLLHDADILVPADYAASIVERLQSGWEAISPLRFLFYLDRQDTVDFTGSGGAHRPSNIEDVRQNFAGGSIAVRKHAYQSLGGFDEEFCGWGGEDVEFFDRLKTCRMFAGGYAPGVHLWHPPAPGKLPLAGNLSLAETKLRTPVAERIVRLREQRASSGRLN